MSSTDDSMETYNIHETLHLVPTQYVKDGVDLGTWVDDFLDNETEYYEDIHSLAGGRSAILRIVDSEGERISSAILLDHFNGENCLVHPVLEVKRLVDDISTIKRKEHGSIIEWYYDVCGEDVLLEDAFNNILIDDERVPLWRVLQLANKHEEDQKCFLAYIQEENRKGDEELLEVAGVTAILMALLSIVAYLLVCVNMNGEL